MIVKELIEKLKILDFNLEVKIPTEGYPLSIEDIYEDDDFENNPVFIRNNKKIIIINSI